MTQAALALVSCSVLAFAAAPRAKSCAGAVSIGTFRLTVRADAKRPPLSLRYVSSLKTGYKIEYQPVQLPGDAKNARLTLVLAPGENDGDNSLIVLEPKPAGSPAEWTIPYQPGLLGVVFGPQGLDEKRVASLVTKDESVINQLARYADETAGLESTINGLNLIEEESGDEPRPRALTPTDEAIFAILQAVNPSAARYDPLGLGRTAGPATLSGQAAVGFFENAGALFPGGGALGELRKVMLPDTEFRTVYVQPEDADAITLCAQRSRGRSRNRMVYLWAHRLVDGTPPAVKLATGADAQIGRRAALPVRLEPGTGFDLLERIFDWTLQPKAGGAAVPIRIRPQDFSRSLQLDLAGFKGAPGAYKLQGRWDWNKLDIDGDVHLYGPSQLKAAQFVAGSESALIAGSGVVPVQLAGANFHFLDRAEIVRPGGWRGTVPADFRIQGAQSDRLDLAIDTNRLVPGDALLRLSTTTGVVEDLPLVVLPEMPKIDGLPLAANSGEKSQVFRLHGTGLDRIKTLEADKATLSWRAISDTEAELTVTLAAAARPGEKLATRLTLAGLGQPVPFAGFLQAAGPRPKITEARASVPEDLGVALRPGELPAGFGSSFLLRTENAGDQPVVAVECAEPGRTLDAKKLRLGERAPGAKLERTAADALLLTLDPALGQPGCNLQATVEAAGSKSDPAPLGKVVRLPKIESVVWTDKKSASGFIAMVTGQDLEGIAKAGWDPRNGTAVTVLPVPVSGDRQSLELALPWPPPAPRAPLVLWLTGDSEGRLTKAIPR